MKKHSIAFWCKLLLEVDQSQAPRRSTLTKMSEKSKNTHTKTQTLRQTSGFLHFCHCGSQHLPVG